MFAILTWNLSIQGHFTHVTKGYEKNDLRLLMDTVNGPKTMTKRNAYHILRALVMGHSVKRT